MQRHDIIQPDEFTAVIDSSIQYLLLYRMAQGIIFTLLHCVHIQIRISAKGVVRNFMQTRKKLLHTLCYSAHSLYSIE